VIASLCWMAGRVDDGIRYVEIGQTVLTDNWKTPPYAMEGWLARHTFPLDNLSSGPILQHAARTSRRQPHVHPGMSGLRLAFSG